MVCRYHAAVARRANRFVLEPRDVAARRAQIRHDLRHGQPPDGPGHVGERGDEQQPHDVPGLLAAAQVRVDHLRDRAPAGRRDVVGNRVLEGRVDLVDLRERLAVRQIDVVGGDQIRVPVRFPEARHHDPHQTDQPACLLEPLVLAEAGVEIADGGMKGVGVGDPAREGLRRRVRHVHLLRVAHRLRVALGDLRDLFLVRQRLEDALAENLIELVRVHPDRLKVHRRAAGLPLQILQRADDLLAPGRVRDGQVGKHEANVAQLVAPDRDQQVGERRRRHHREVGVADALRGRVHEVGRQLVQHDDERVAAQQVHPRRLAGRGERRVVVLEVLSPAELRRNRAPDAERRVALAPGERHHPHRPDVPRSVEAPHDLVPVFRVPGEQTEREQVVRLAAAHRLGQLEHALRRFALETPEPLGKQRLHPPP